MLTYIGKLFLLFYLYACTVENVIIIIIIDITFSVIVVDGIKFAVFNCQSNLMLNQFHAMYNFIYCNSSMSSMCTHVRILIYLL